MNLTTPFDRSGPILLPLRTPQGFSTSWAGPGPGDKFCLGSEDGKLFFSDANGTPAYGFAWGDESVEAVNGVAFIGSSVAVSTRNEVTLLTLPHPGIPEVRGALFPCGSHGVVATESGHFVCPLGRTGLMKALLSEEDHQRFSIRRAKHRTLNFYKAIHLCADSLPGVVVCAARSGGIVASDDILRDDEPSQVFIVSRPGLDVVDVCSLGSDATNPAIAALGRDGTLVLSKNAMHDRSPATIKFEGITGIAYRVFQAKGSLVVLTSHGIFAMLGLASRFSSGAEIDHEPISVRHIPMEAVDANACGENWLLVVLPEMALRLNLGLFLADTSPEEHLDQAHPSPSSFHPEWIASEIATEPFALGVR